MDLILGNTWSMSMVKRAVHVRHCRVSYPIQNASQSRRKVLAKILSSIESVWAFGLGFERERHYHGSCPMQEVHLNSIKTNAASFSLFFNSLTRVVHTEER